MFHINKALKSFWKASQFPSTPSSPSEQSKSCPSVSKFFISMFYDWRMIQKGHQKPTVIHSHNSMIDLYIKSIFHPGSDSLNAQEQRQGVRFNGWKRFCVPLRKQKLLTGIFIPMSIIKHLLWRQQRVLHVVIINYLATQSNHCEVNRYGLFVYFESPWARMFNKEFRNFS